MPPSHNITSTTPVWKIASRFSTDGHINSCILDIFRDTHTVFLGHEHPGLLQIKEGDLIAISSGKTVVAIGQALKDSSTYQDSTFRLPNEYAKRLDSSYIGFVCRVKFEDLPEEDWVPYRIGAFHAVREKAQLYRDLFSKMTLEKESGMFSIDAGCYTLKEAADAKAKALLAPGNLYHIPIFQRPYSWGESEIRRLMNDFLNSFGGLLGRSKREPMFIGTMQLAAAECIDINGYTRRYDLIDGQQRMTSVTLLLKALSLISNGTDVKPPTWLQTAVGGGSQQDLLTAALTHPHPETAGETNNPYLNNLAQITASLRDSELVANQESLKDFHDYLVSKVHFVVIETRAGLSKTLQIFDSINTAGMDLNGGDLFKIRYFEYLREVEQAEEKVFEEIAALYNKIDGYNQEVGRNELSVEQILSVLKWIVCARLDLPYQAMELAGTTFFDRLFDTTLKIDIWDGFSPEKCKGLKLPISLIDEVIEATISHRSFTKDTGPEPAAMDIFCWWSRYSNYYEPIRINFFWRFSPSKVEWENFQVSLGKLLIIYSLRSQKITYDGRGEMHKLLQLICKGGKGQEAIRSWIQDRLGQYEADLRNLLMTDWIAGIPKSKNLLCRLDAMLDELNDGASSGADLCDLLFHKGGIDIEHIESANHRDGSIRQDIQEEWGQDLHGLGNLMILEFDINRSIGNAPFHQKREAYKGSSFVTARIVSSKEIWDLKTAITRKEQLTEKLATYLCRSIDSSSQAQIVNTH